jgi:hypothetical protein
MGYDMKTRSAAAQRDRERERERGICLLSMGVPDGVNLANHMVVCLPRVPGSLGIFEYAATYFFVIYPTNRH